MTPALPSPLAVVCHDAAGAQLILPWLDLDQTRVQAWVQGPAAALWHDLLGERGRVASLDDALDGAALLITGTSLAQDLEHRARLHALALGVPSVAVLDGWTHYAARFQRDGHRVLPDQIWVTDAEAYTVAQARFPTHDVRLQPNLHQRRLVELMAPCPNPQRRQTVLVVLDRLADEGGLAAVTAALDLLLAHHTRLGLQAPLCLRLRLHPDDHASLAPWLDAAQAGSTGGRPHAAPEIHLDDSPDLASALDRVAWVAGLGSAALVLAMAAGRRAVCLLPPGAPPGRLPHRGLIHLRQLLQAADTRDTAAGD